MIEQSVREFVDSLAARTPTPGGGSAAACAAAMGVGLLAMAARFSQGKSKNDADAEARLETALAGLDDLRARMLPMVERDAVAFERVAAAYKLSRDGAQAKEIRDRAIQEALLGAMAVPEECLCLVRDALEVFTDVDELIGRNIVSDVGAGTALLTAAAEMARLNVKINVAYLHDRDLADAASARVGEVLADIDRYARRNREVVEGLLSV